MCHKNAFRSRFSFEGSETFSVLEQKSFRVPTFQPKTLKIMPFVTLANPAGQPVDFIIKPATGDETLKDVPGKAVCKWFWLLKELTVDIGYTVDGTAYSFSRKIIANKEAFNPKDRLCNSLEFSLNESNGGSEAFYSFDLVHVYQSKNAKNCFDLKFSILEYAKERDVCFSTDPTSPSNSSLTTFKLVDKLLLKFETFPITLYAWIKEQEETKFEAKAKIDKCQITTTYFNGM
jgi:hypothetical protein